MRSSKTKKEVQIDKVIRLLKSIHIKLGGINSQTYKINYLLKKEILERDGNKCIFCKSNKKLNIHHIIPRKKNSYLIENKHNLITVCYICHKTLHYYYDNTEKYIKENLIELLKKLL